jgi:peptidyl-prolyl cis-trans isomerase B (cyclophilin B)
MKPLVAILLLGAALARAEGDSKVKNPVVVVTTSLGSFTAELYPDKAPESVKNFLQYVDDKFYDGTVFHRVISNFMIQGGGMDQNLQKKANRPPIKNEAANGLKNTKGTLAMARTNVPDSATSQFFVNVKDNGFLDFKDASPQGIGYCVFGKVTSGMDVVDKIKDVPTGTQGGMGDVPTTPVVIQSIRRQQ